MKKIGHALALTLLSISYGLSLLCGYAMVSKKTTEMIDFQCVYYATSSLLHGHDPYKQAQLYAFYREQTGDLATPTDTHIQTITQFIYLPTVFLFVAPFAVLPWGSASLLWSFVLVVIFGLAVYLMWNLSESKSSGVAISLTAIVLINCVVLTASGNAAGIVVGTCVIGVWCFTQQRFAAIGVLCLAISLAIKPHDSGFVWLYFLLAGGIYRKRAFQVLALSCAFALIGLAWTMHSAPKWWPELRGNLIVNSAPGSPSDAGPSSPTARSVSGVIDLETAVRIFSDNTRIYRPLTYTICGALLSIWVVATLFRRFSPERTWLALAAIVPLTMVSTYHRPYDAKLLLLSIPACAMLWIEGGAIGFLALVFTTAGIVITGDIPLVIFIRLASRLKLEDAGLLGKVLTVLLTRPASVALLLLAVFYLWVYARRSFFEAPASEQNSPREASANA